MKDRHLRYIQRCRNLSPLSCFPFIWRDETDKEGTWGVGIDITLFSRMPPGCYLVPMKEDDKIQMNSIPKTYDLLWMRSTSIVYCSQSCVILQFAGPKKLKLMSENPRRMKRTSLQEWNHRRRIAKYRTSFSTLVGTIGTFFLPLPHSLRTISSHQNQHHHRRRPLLVFLSKRTKNYHFKRFHLTLWPLVRPSRRLLSS